MAVVAGVEDFVEFYFRVPDLDRFAVVPLQAGWPVSSKEEVGVARSA